MNSIQLKTVSTVDAVCETLENDIFSLRYKPGAKITENDLSSRYGVSRNTIREAMAFLLSNGLLMKVANKGVYVRKMTMEDIRDVFHLRELLEREAVRMLTEHGDVPPALEQAAEEMERHDINLDWEANIKADIRFHQILVNAAGSARLSRLYGSISAEVKLCIFQSHDIVPTRHENVVQHRLIIDAIQNRNLEEALRLLSGHMESAVHSYEVGFRTKDQSKPTT